MVYNLLRRRAREGLVANQDWAVKRCERLYRIGLPVLTKYVV
jgi:hypothetical protein